MMGPLVQICVFHCFFKAFSCFPCILRLGSCCWRSLAQIFCQHALFESSMGARTAP